MELMPLSPSVLHTSTLEMFLWVEEKRKDYLNFIYPFCLLFRSRFQRLIWGSRLIWPCWCNKLERWSLSHGHLRATTPRARHLIWFCRNRLFNVTWNAVFVPVCSKWAVISEQWAVRQTLKTNVAINTHRHAHTQASFRLIDWACSYINEIWTTAS